MIILIVIIVVLLGVILFGAGKIRNIEERNRNLVSALSKNSNTFREKGIEIDELKKAVKDSEDTCKVLEKENKRLRILC